MTAYAKLQLGQTLAGEPAERLSPTAHTREAELFQLAVRADSHLELDWLWLYMQLTSPAHRRYALERALAINSQSAIARRELELLEPTA